MILCVHTDLTSVPVQNYITAIIIFLIVEMLMTWGFYGSTTCTVCLSVADITSDYLNRAGSNFGSKALMIIVAILNAGRNSFSFFLLLIVCMGYGVVKPSLGKTMVYVRWLAGGHFLFGLIYAIASLTITPEEAGECYNIIKQGQRSYSSRSARTLRHLTPCWHSDRLLCLDAKLP